MKKSWNSKTSRHDTNKYDCQTCSKKQEKARNRRNEWRKTVLTQSLNEAKNGEGEIVKDVDSFLESL